MLDMRRWRILNNGRLKLFTISGFAIVVTDEKIHLLIVVHKIVNRGGPDIQGARIVKFSLQEAAMPWPKERKHKYL